MITPHTILDAYQQVITANELSLTLVIALSAYGLYTALGNSLRWAADKLA